MAGEPTNRARKTNPALLALMFVIAGALLMAWGAGQLRLAHTSRRWPSVPGRIVTSSINERRDRDRRRQFWADVSYEYQVNGVQYTANRVSFMAYSSSSRAHAQQVVGHYRTGANVTVYYRPGRPAEAVLERGLNAPAVLVPAVGFLFAATGLIVFFRGRGARAGGSQMV
jgi:hypothetical protein